MRLKSLARSCLSAALCASLLSACAGGQPTIGGDPGLQVVGLQGLPEPDRVDLSASSWAYYVGPFDSLTIDVFGIEELSEREVRVDSAGRISFPLVGVIDVSGKTPAEIEQLLTERLRASYVRDPQVTVNLKETVSQVITIEGEVEKPGLYPVIGRMTLMRAIAKAEGTTEFSRLNDVVVFRTVRGQRLAALYNLDAIRHGAYADPDVFANDVVMVGESTSRRFFKDFVTTVSLVGGPLIIALDRIVN